MSNKVYSYYEVKDHLIIAKYIVEEDLTVLYINIMDSGWERAQGSITFKPNSDTRLIETFTEKELQDMLFLEGI